jgi:ADP-heptose:LPS heptosyltransferase
MKIAVFRALQLGDLLCIVPALRALRAAHPAAHIALIGLPWARAFAARFHSYLDDFIEFPGFPGMPERDCEPAAVQAFLGEMAKRKFDLIFQMHGDGRFTNPLVALMGATQIAGFHVPGQLCPDPPRFPAWRPREHEVTRYLRLLEHAGIQAKGTQLEFPLADADRRECDSFGLGDAPYAVVHPGSQLASRRWPAQRFAEVADALAADGMRVVLTGTGAEIPLVQETKAFMLQPALDLAGRTTLGGLAALLSRARLLVANDTGLSHIAAATQTPSVIVACGSDPQRWAPLNCALHRVLWREIECRPCAHRECPIGHPCALGVSAREVLDEIRSLVQCAA